MYVSLGDYERAEPLRTRGLEIETRVQGEQHPEYLDDGGQSWNPVPGARQVPRRPSQCSQGIWKRGTACSALSTRRRSRRCPTWQSRISARAAIRGLSQLPGESSRFGAVCWARNIRPARMPSSCLGLIQQHQRKYAEAETAAREALSSAEKISPDHWRRFNSSSLLGAALAGQGKI